MAVRSVCTCCLILAVFVIALGGQPTTSFQFCINKEYFRELENRAFSKDVRDEFGGDLPEEYLPNNEFCIAWNRTRSIYQANLDWKEQTVAILDLARISALDASKTRQMKLVVNDGEMADFRLEIKQELDSVALKVHVEGLDQGRLSEPNKRHTNTFTFACLSAVSPRAVPSISVSYEILLSPSDLSEDVRLDFNLPIRIWCNETTPTTTPVSTKKAELRAAPQRSSDNTSMKVISASIAVTFFVTFILGLLCNLVRKKRSSPSFKDENKVEQNKPDLKSCAIKPEEIIFIKEIGQGAFGVVYEGTYQDNVVAIKTLKAQHQLDNEMAKRLLDEAVIMKSLDHPNILPLIGVSFPKKNSPLIVVPFMEKGDLRTFLQKHNPTSLPGIDILSLATKFNITLQIAFGMSYLSQKGFVHRDLAARNCMLDNNFLVKIGDFGLGRDIHNEQYYRSSSQFLLPVKWMALESLLYYKFTNKTDVWSFGVTMWEVLSSGQIPYGGIGNAQIVDYLKAGNRLPQPEDCPDELYGLMTKCWQTQPLDRPSFQEVLSVLQEFDYENYYMLVTMPIYQRLDGIANSLHPSEQKCRHPNHVTTMDTQYTYMHTSTVISDSPEKPYTYMHTSTVISDSPEKPYPTAIELAMTPDTPTYNAMALVSPSTVKLLPECRMKKNGYINDTAAKTF